MRLIIEDRPLLVLPSLAVLIGLNEAIILQQIHYLARAKGQDIDGARWVYQSIGGWCEQFPFFSEKTIKRALASLKKRGLVVSTAKFNRMKIDRTLWYAVDYATLEELEKQSLPSGQSDPIASGQSDPMTSGHSDPTNNKRGKEKEKTEYKGDSPSAKPKTWRDDPAFVAAWAIYPKRAGGNSPADAWKAWKARLKEGFSTKDLAAGVTRYAKFCDATQRTGTEYVKQARTFFGPSEHFIEAWDPPAQQPGAQHGTRQRTLSAVERVRQQTASQQAYTEPDDDALEGTFERVADRGGVGAYD